VSCYTKFALVAEEDGLMWNIQLIGGWETFVEYKALCLGRLRPEGCVRRFEERFRTFVILLRLGGTYIADVSSGKILC
jgi:hypothetical protein